MVINGREGGGGGVPNGQLGLCHKEDSADGIKGSHT